jgi:glycoprotein-N-acetylgalactosamine 3-beta-galactosyltransferase
VFIRRRNFHRKAMAVHNTWGQACDTLLFMASDANLLLKTKKELKYAFLSNYSENDSKLAMSTIKVILHVYANYQKAYDWMLKVNDDTYVVVDNLKSFLKANCSSYGNTHRHSAGQGSFLSSGPGYLLSSHMVNAFVLKYYMDANFCKQELSGARDFPLTRCLYKIGLRSGDSRDEHGLQLFHQSSYETSKKEANSKNQVNNLSKLYIF